MFSTNDVRSHIPKTDNLASHTFGDIKLRIVILTVLVLGMPTLVSKVFKEWNASLNGIHATRMYAINVVVAWICDQGMVMHVSCTFIHWGLLHWGFWYHYDTWNLKMSSVLMPTYSTCKSLDTWVKLLIMNVGSYCITKIITAYTKILLPCDALQVSMFELHYNFNKIQVGSWYQYWYWTFASLGS